jgi:hypothetical protein
MGDEPHQDVHMICGGAHSQNTAVLASDPPESGNVSTSAPNEETLQNTTLLAIDPRESDTTTPFADDEQSPNTSLLAAPPKHPQERKDNRFDTSHMEFLSMFGLLLVGGLTAIGHHLFYSYLNNKEVDQAGVGQTWAIRTGTAFAYLFKTTLVAAIAVVYAQCFWFIVRRNFFEIGSLDDFFALLTNPLLFYHRSLYGKASLLFGLAMVSWLLPISAVFAPGALTGSLPLQTP